MLMSATETQTDLLKTVNVGFNDGIEEGGTFMRGFFTLNFRYV